MSGAAAPRCAGDAVSETTLVVDIGGTRMRIGHLIGAEASADMGSASSDLLRVDDPVSALVDQLQRYAFEQALEPTAVVLGVPFSPDPGFETALSSPNIPSFEGKPIRSRLSRALGVPVHLERDINLLMLGEWASGAAVGAEYALGMFVGTGVGGSFLQGGVPYRGATGSAVELGHIPIRAEGRRCVCGNVDCLEAYACGHVLHELARRARVPIAEVFVQAPRHQALQRDLDDFVRDLAYALATAVNLFHPNVAVVGGGIPAMVGFPHERFATTFAAHLRRPAPSSTVALRWACLGSRASLFGAHTLITNPAAQAVGRASTADGPVPPALDAASTATERDLA